MADVFPIVFRSDFCASLVDQSIYVAGGWPTGFTESLASVEVLDIGKKQWKEIAAMPTPRGDCKCAELSGEFVVIGGYHDETNQWMSDSFRDEVEAFDPVRTTAQSFKPFLVYSFDYNFSTLHSCGRLINLGEHWHHYQMLVETKLLSCCPIIDF